ncbi:MAG: UDP-2,4-diacetamido-2,4,6-trideoxy-beta-L-altropyranose hydrolase, partial [Planctomycetes bacterium]|nr:UDP-2,4-diacetamido-2,4,6-trideoxy-beta-L-altropyranose hydrolase [Planctomycetota bacterium]
MSYLLVRADAGPQVGVGHVMRSLALVQAWQDRGGRAGFVLGEQARSLEARLAAEKVEVFPSAGPPGSPDDAARLVETARTSGAAWVVADGYAFGSGFQRAITEAGLRLLAIDDHGRAGTYTANLILDPNLETSEASYARRPPSCRLLAGLRYALLRREFRFAPGGERPTPPVARRLLVTLGGSDPGNVTLKVLKALESAGSSGMEVVVVIGPANPHRASLEEAARRVPGTVRLESPAARMAELMAWADAAVSAAGGTCWELMRLGVPPLLVVAAENQRPNLAPIVAAGAAVSGETDLAGALAGLVSNAALRRELSAKGRSLVDGKGADRAAAV